MASLSHILRNIAADPPVHVHHFSSDEFSGINTFTASIFYQLHVGCLFCLVLHLGQAAFLGPLTSCLLVGLVLPPGLPSCSSWSG